MTRFLQFFILIPFIFFLIIQKKDKLKNILNLAYGFSIVFIPYLILNLALYKNPIYPFTLQIFMSRYTGWIFNQPLSFYFINLLKENFLLLFSIVGTIIILKKTKDQKKTTILSIFLLFFILFNSIAHKEMRFTLVFLPYMYLISSYGLTKTLNSIKKRKNVFYITITIIGIIWLIQTVNQIEAPPYAEYPEFTNYIAREDIKDGLWISNPVFIANSNKKADELIYYPLYNSKKITKLKEKFPKANHILIDTCDILPCPEEDKDCNKETKDLLDSLKRDFTTVHNKKELNCEQFIFTSLP